MPFNLKKASFIALTFFGMFSVTGLLAAPEAVPTYHYDNQRTGWNANETTLTATSFPSTFGLTHTVALDDQVDAQPLLVPGLTIAGGTHDVVYVVTESNTVYAIDASSGAILLRRNLGAAVPTPLGCTNNGPQVGITGTPVIDLTTHTLYLIAYISGPPTYKLHALNLSDLTDKASSPVTVTASHTLTDGSVYKFDAAVQRQRPGLLELNGNVYAGFGSFCDFSASLSRGWVLGWAASNLSPLTGNHLVDSLATSSSNFFLSAVWMSGYGLSGDPGTSGAILVFSTGNSSANTYTGSTNIQESIVKLSSNMLNLSDIFTPSNHAQLDNGDVDLGSGGIMMLPTQGGNVPHLIVGGGKDGRLFLLNRLNMTTPLDTHFVGECWCGPSYFVGSDGVARIVTSHSDTIITWDLDLSPSPHLVQEGSVNITTGQDPGFFTVVSSNGTRAGTGIIWAVGRPSGATSVNLFAFAATASGGTHKLLFSSPAGSWPDTNANANIVPMVANGKVYVASNKALAIFGVLSGHAPQIAPPPPSPVASLSGPHVITGTLLTIDGSTLTLQARTGETEEIDDSQAAQDEQVSILHVGEPVTVQGSSFTATGALLATSIVRAKLPGDLWPPDQ
jgi:hypothetical protein